MIGRRPAASAAAMPRSISSSVPKRMTFLSRSGLKVSTWTLMRPRPASARGPASRGSRIALVVIDTSSTPGRAAMRPTISTRSGRRVGSPPVSRNFRKPTLTAAAATRSISSAVNSSGEGMKLSPRSGMQ